MTGNDNQADRKRKDRTGVIQTLLGGIGDRPEARTRIVTKQIFTGVSAIALVVSLVAIGMLASPIGATNSLSGENGRIACGDNADGDFEIVTQNPDGSDRRQLTENENVSDIGPTWSPDGTRLAFARGSHGAEDIWVMYQDGSGQKRLTTNPAEDRAGSWTPDGEHIAYHSFRETLEDPGSREIVIMDDDGTNQTQLTDNLVFDTFAHVSPDGEKIAFTSNRAGSFNVHTMDIDGSNVSRVTTLGVEDAHGSWSPDGSQIVFHSRRGLHAPALEIYRKNADGSGSATRLTNDGATSDGNNFDAFPVWSPDGSRILWNRGHSPNGTFTLDAFTMDATDGGSKTNVTDNNNGNWDSRCDWEARQPCTISGSGTIAGTDGDDVICGSDGADDISTGAGNDTVRAGGDDDTVKTGAGSDVVFGEQGNDEIKGKNGSDTLFGDRGDDVLKGGTGDDVLSGSEGTDQVKGGSGQDECGGETETNCEQELDASG